uniref:Uncharacterized protein n=1 Tax=Anguilla anguilla TaxID=7936 RepID=A0A0E9WBF4_ANGAN
MNNVGTVEVLCSGSHGLFDATLRILEILPEFPDTIVAYPPCFFNDNQTY